MACTQNDTNDTALYPILPTTIRDARYQSNTRVNVTSINIPLGTHFSSAPSYQPEGWVVSVHSEGKRYAHNKLESGLSLVTEAHVSDPMVAERLEDWVGYIRNIAAEKDVYLPETSDLFLEVDDDAGICNYWFADHTHRTIFWLHPVDSIDVALPNVYSKAHLQYALEENYWAHVEMFPATASPYALTALNELEVILLNARADALTSDVPTFPYTAEESERFINLLRHSKEHASNPFVTTYVARLWGIVANHRFFTHFGEDHCRLSATHSVLDAPARKHSFILTAISKVLFDMPNEHRTRLETLWVDDLVYTSAWRKYVSERIQDLKLNMLWLISLVIANILIFPLAYLPILNKFSILLCTVGLGVDIILYEEQRKLDGTGATTGAAYLDVRNTTYGFQPTAIVHSIPRAVFVWAAVFFTVQGFWMSLADIPRTLLLPIAIPAAAVFGLAFFGVWVALHPREKPFEEATLPADV